MKYFFNSITKLCLIIVISTFFTISIQAQNSDINTEGMYNAEFFDYVYRGHFENVELKREEPYFLGIFEQYLRAYGEQCADYLPDNKVKIMEQVCVKERVTTNGYGVETNRYCVEWEWVWTGLYARPDLYNAKMDIEQIHRANGLKNVMEYIMNPNSLGNSVDLAHKAKGLKIDMSRIFNLNTCDCDALRKFEENLKLFALNKPAIRMQGTSKYAAMKESGGPTGSQDFSKLIDDLVSAQAQTWMFNRYTAGSISGVSIESKDNQGRPASVKADYTYSGFSGNSKGWVKIIFSNGLPKCIYFFDFPDNCKTPTTSIVSSYAQGNYAK